ncbi:MAG: substrate-binding domain-containing protein [Methylobacteriaceae bacterium]|nr:substrate-binding domain-containing protein [Methylobacteriaceae bacterium]
MQSEIAGISSMATRQILADLADACERRTGCRLVFRPMGGVDAARLIRAGEATDIIILASNAIEQLESEGHVVRGSRLDFARSGIAVAVPSGAARPTLADEESVKHAILQAARLCYSSGPSGDHLVQLCKRWGIHEAVSRRALLAPPGVPVATLLASEEADLGFQQLSELIDAPGIDIVGPLPPEIQAVTVFSAGICSASTKPDAAGTVIGYLASRDAEAAKRRHGMEPA